MSKMAIVDARSCWCYRNCACVKLTVLAGDGDWCVLTQVLN